jgi:nucleolysin TIA-1/TIAR
MTFFELVFLSIFNRRKKRKRKRKVSPTLNVLFNPRSLLILYAACLPTIEYKKKKKITIMNRKRSREDENATHCSVYVGNLSPAATDLLLYMLFSHFGAVSKCRVVRNKVNPAGAGFAFVDFYTHESAAAAIATYNGQTVGDYALRLNWARGVGASDDFSNSNSMMTHQNSRASSRSGDGATSDVKLFVGDLSEQVDDSTLGEAFSSFGVLANAHVARDAATGQSRGFGFVEFSEPSAAQMAMTSMHGQMLGSRPIRVNRASLSRSFRPQHPQQPSYSSLSSSFAPPHLHQRQQAQAMLDPSNMSAYVGNLPPDVNESLLRTLFSPFGAIVSVRFSSNFGFIDYAAHASAAAAIVAMDQFNVHGRNIKVSWARSSSSSSSSSPAPPSSFVSAPIAPTALMTAADLAAAIATTKASLTASNMQAPASLPDGLPPGLPPGFDLSSAISTLDQQQHGVIKRQRLD